MRWKYKTLLLLAICNGVTVCSQPQSFDRAFLSHLLELELRSDAELYARKSLNDGLPLSTRDSLHYLIGKIHMEVNPDTSIHYFGLLLSHSGPFYRPSKRNLFYQYFKEERLQEATQLLKNTDPEEVETKCGKKYLEAVLSVMKREELPVSEGCLEDERFEKLREMDKQLKKAANKSGFKAGLLSAIIPGLGRVYTGHTGQGAATFLGISLLAAQSLEGYYKGGLDDPHFIVFGALFSVFYIGNIWGSALSATVIYDQKYDVYKARILASFGWKPTHWNYLP